MPGDMKALKTMLYVGDGGVDDVDYLG